MTVTPKTLTEAYLSVYEPQSISEEVQIATEYFYECGLNEYGIDILIEELGLDEFVDFVYDIAKSYTLDEARRLKPGERSLPSSTIRKITGKDPSKVSKKDRERIQAARQSRREVPSSTGRLQSLLAARSGQIQAGKESSKERLGAIRSRAVETPKTEEPKAPLVRRHRKHGKVVPGPRPSTPSQQPERGAAIEKAKVEQPRTTSSQKGIKDAIAGHINRFLDSEAFKKGVQRHNASLDLFNKVFRTEEFENWVDTLLDEGYDLSEYTWNDMLEIYEDVIDLEEKRIATRRRKRVAASMFKQQAKMHHEESYEYILSHLLDEGYADSIEGAEKIASCMSEEWIDDILDEAEQRKKPAQMGAPIPRRMVTTREITGKEKLTGPAAPELGPSAGSSWTRLTPEQEAEVAARRKKRGKMSPYRVG